MDKQNLFIFQKKLPKPGNYRQRAHINILRDTPFPYPLNPNYVNWSIHFQNTQIDKIMLNTKDYPLDYNQMQEHNQFQVDFADIGCGFGGLLFALSRKYPNNLSFGMEIRDKLVNYVGQKIVALRHNNQGQYQNISVVRTNAQRHITNYFKREQVFLKLIVIQIILLLSRSTFQKIKIKNENHQAYYFNQSTSFLSEFAYVLKPKGRIYCITDVESLHNWHELHLGNHSMFKKISQDELEQDVLFNKIQECIELMLNETEEGKRVTRNNGSKFYCVYEKI